MTRINAKTGTVTRTIRANAAGRRHRRRRRRSGDEATGNVRGIDPTTNPATSTATAGLGPAGIAYGGGSLWVAERAG